MPKGVRPKGANSHFVIPVFSPGTVLRMYILGCDWLLLSIFYAFSLNGNRVGLWLESTSKT